LSNCLGVFCQSSHLDNGGVGARLCTDRYADVH
jgi:hypothetical protein